MGVVGIAKFNRKLYQFSRTLVPKQVTLLMKKIGLDILTGVVLLTPVDSGRARGGWQVSINESPEGTSERLDKIGADTVSEGIGQMAKIAITDKIFITNNVEYIGYLENGTPKMPAHGMLALTIQRIEQAFGG